MSQSLIRHLSGQIRGIYASAGVSSFLLIWLLLKSKYLIPRGSCCSDFEDIFDVKHFIDSLRDEVRIIRRLPKRYKRKHNRKYKFQPLVMQPISWSSEKYYLEQVSSIVHFGINNRGKNCGLSGINICFFFCWNGTQITL